MIETKQDFNGVDLKIGDTVAFITPYENSLAKGKVVWFTPKMIRVEYAVARKGWRIDPNKPDIVLRLPCELTKIA